MKLNKNDFFILLESCRELNISCRIVFSGFISGNENEKYILCMTDSLIILPVKKLTPFMSWKEIIYPDGLVFTRQEMLMQNKFPWIRDTAERSKKWIIFSSATVPLSPALPLLIQSCPNYKKQRHTQNVIFALFIKDEFMISYLHRSPKEPRSQPKKFALGQSEVHRKYECASVQKTTSPRGEKEPKAQGPANQKNVK